MNTVARLLGIGTVKLRVCPYWFVDFRRAPLCTDQKHHHASMAGHRAKRRRECAKVAPAIPMDDVQ